MRSSSDDWTEAIGKSVSESFTCMMLLRACCTTSNLTHCLHRLLLRRKFSPLRKASSLNYLSCLSLSSHYKRERHPRIPHTYIVLQKWRNYAIRNFAGGVREFQISSSCAFWTFAINFYNFSPNCTYFFGF